MVFGRTKRPASPPQPAPQWEYRNVSVPLGVRGRGHVMQMSKLLDPILENGVAAACRDGWEPAEPVNIVWLSQHSRVRSQLDTTGVIYESASVKLKRLRV